MTSSSKPLITAFKDSPDRGRGLARDMRVRWAFEEVGQGYDVELLTFDEMKQPGYRALQPFGQIPTYRNGDLTLFESGAIVLHIAESGTGLLPSNPAARARAIGWMFSALNTIEMPIVEREQCILTEKDQSWYEARLPILEQRVHRRLKELSTRLRDSAWLDGEFSAADLLLVTVLQRPAGRNLLPSYPNLFEYVKRAEERPAYRRAFAAQLAVFTASQQK